MVQKKLYFFSIKFPKANNDFPCIHLYMGWDPQGGNFLEQDFVCLGQDIENFLCGHVQRR